MNQKAIQSADNPASAGSATPARGKKSIVLVILIVTIALALSLGVIWMSVRGTFTEDALLCDSVSKEFELGIWNFFPSFMAQCEKGVRLSVTQPVRAEKLMLEAQERAVAARAAWWELLEIHYRLGKFYYQQQRDKDAIDVLQRALSDLNDSGQVGDKMLRNGSIHQLLANAYLRSHDAANSVRNSNAAITILGNSARNTGANYDGNAFNSYVLLAQAQTELGELNEAMVSLNSARAIVLPSGTRPSKDLLLKVDKLLATAKIQMKQYEGAYPLIDEIFRLAKDELTLEKGVELCVAALKGEKNIADSGKKFIQLARYRWDDDVLKRISRKFPELSR